MTTATPCPFTPTGTETEAAVILAHIARVQAAPRPAFVVSEIEPTDAEVADFIAKLAAGERALKAAR